MIEQTATIRYNMFFCFQLQQRVYLHWRPRETGAGISTDAAGEGREVNREGKKETCERKKEEEKRYSEMQSKARKQF
jgi:hypothetical protein